MVDRFKGLRVQGCGSGFAANSNGALRAGPLSLPLAGKGDRASGARVLSLIACLRCISPLIFHTASTLSGSLRLPPSPRGEGFVRPYCFSTHACIRSDDARKAVFSFLSLPHWGRGTALAVDRVLSLIVDLRCISPLIFHTASTLSGSLRSPPSPRGEGFVSRIALFSYRSLPHWGRGTASAVDRVLSYIVDLRRISPLIFHTASTLSGSLRSPPSPRGEGYGYTRNVIKTRGAPIF